MKMILKFFLLIFFVLQAKATPKLTSTRKGSSGRENHIDDYQTQMWENSHNPRMANESSSLLLHSRRYTRVVRELPELFENNNTQEVFCRTRHGRYLPKDLFAKDTCAACYSFERHKYRKLQWPWREKNITYTNGEHDYLILGLVGAHDQNEQAFVVDALFDEIFQTVANDKIGTNWRSCCEAAVRCCNIMLSAPPGDTNRNVCPRTWDGWQCWPDALPDTVINEKCPSYSYIHDVPPCHKLSTKSCTVDGSWFRKSGHEWTDYISCGESENIRRRLVVHIGALVLSVLTLGPALFIFCYYRQLRVHRISLHKQLFISLLLEATCSIIFRMLQLFARDTIETSPSWCVALHIFHKYIRQTNYMWYLCEGFYLHKLLATAFAEQRSIAAFYFVGWVLPLVPVGVYGILRGLWYNTDHCWTIPAGGLEYLIQIPPLIAIMINFIFLINIIRIFLGKVRARLECEPSQFKMTVKAGLMVIPLFGLQYIATIYRPTGRACSWLEAYHIVNNIIDGSTGFLVGIIFCYTNSEVRSLVRRSVRNVITSQEEIMMQRRDQGAFRSRTLSTVQTMLMDVRRSSSLTRQNQGLQNLPTLYTSKQKQKPSNKRESNETIEELSHETQHENSC